MLLDPRNRHLLVELLPEEEEKENRQFCCLTVTGPPKALMLQLDCWKEPQIVVFSVLMVVCSL